MKKVLLMAIGSVLIYSCNDKKVEATPDMHNEIEMTMHDEHHDQDASKAIGLNKGQKWVVNDEMKPFVMKGEQLVNTYLEKKQTDYKTLAKEVKAENNQLIISCTMDGESHDELHKWLHPHLELVKELENATNPAQADAIVLNLQKSYQQYHEYFN